MICLTYFIFTPKQGRMNNAFGNGFDFGRLLTCFKVCRMMRG